MRHIPRQVVHPRRNRASAQHFLLCRLVHCGGLTRRRWRAEWPVERIPLGGETQAQENLLNCLGDRPDLEMGSERSDKTNQVTSRVLFETGKRAHYPCSGVSDRSLLRRLRVHVHGHSSVQFWKESEFKKVGEDGISGKCFIQVGRRRE